MICWTVTGVPVAALPSPPAYLPRPRCGQKQSKRFFSHIAVFPAYIAVFLESFCNLYGMGRY